MKYWQAISPFLCCSVSSFGQPRTDVVHGHLVRGDSHSHVPRIAKKCALLVSIVFQIADAVVAGKARLGDHLIDNSIEFLPGEEIVVGLEDGRHVVAHEQLVNRRVPSGAVLLEAIAAVRVLAAPFVERRDFNASARSLVPAEEVVDEDEFESCPALLKRLFEPPILRLAQRPPPAVAAAALPDRIPEGIEHNEERIAPLPGVVILRAGRSAVQAVLFPV